MVSINNVDDIAGRTILGFCGLSTDNKPVDKFHSEIIRNGSTFLEMDTSNVYIYDEENKIWYKL